MLVKGAALKQILQNLSSGVTELADVPCPMLTPGRVLIRTSRSLVSAGTERMLVDFGKANLFDKARQQPDKVRMVVAKARTDGIMPTIEAVRSKLDQPLPLGYCNAGVVLDAGAGVSGFAPGDRVVSNGHHAEVVAVPVNLCARVPDGVSDDQAAFTVLAAIALQGIRLAAPTLGETVVVTGLGLIGLITVQLLRSHGCRVLGLDVDPTRIMLARTFGAEAMDVSGGADPIAAAQAFSRGRGVDAVLVTASTKSSEPMHQAAQMCRKRGRIVLVGVTGLELSRADFYEKELTFQVSCSYGPGRYDPNYEDKGQDYPIGFVRWTEQRNFEAVLDLMADGRLDVEPLISHRFALAEAAQAYGLLGNGTPSLGILLDYPAVSEAAAEAAHIELRRRTIALPRASVAPTRPISATQTRVKVGFIGSGNYAAGVLMPAFKAAGADLWTIVSGRGVTGNHAGRKFGFRQATTEPNSVFQDNDITAVVIATRHDSHADYVCQALAAGKHVFVEKPLALRHDDIDRIASAYSQAVARGKPPVLMVGFNRRFAPQVIKMKALLAKNSAPKAFVMTINAGAIPAEHWTQDAVAGGGRLVGEGCHFIDLLRYLADAPIATSGVTHMAAATRDTFSIQLGFANGSIGSIHYFANGDKSLAKERLEVFAGGHILQLDNFRKLTGFGWPGFSKLNLWRQDKGQASCAAAFVRAVEGGSEAPIPFEEILDVSRVAVELG